MVLIAALIVTTVLIKYKKDKSDDHADEVRQLVVKLTKAIEERDKAAEELKKVTASNEALLAKCGRIDELQNQVNYWEERANILKGQQEDLSAHAGQQLAALNERQAEMEKVAADLVHAKEELTQVDSVLGRRKEEVQRLVEELERLQTENRLAVLRGWKEEGGENGWPLEVSGRDMKLVKLIRTIEEEYGDLKSELAAIEWRKVWMPAMQRLVKREEADGCCGIYRLVLKDDVRVCYVGQAVNIKERWYQHAKKMIGVESSGGEKLYEDHLIEDFYWEVVERVNDRRLLNERERWWIDWYGCTEIGLNKK